MSDWHKTEISEVSLEFGTDTKNGRVNIDSSRVRKHNNNVFCLPITDAKSIVKHMASDASLILLAVTYLLTSLLGHAYESVFGIAFVTVVFVLGCLLKYQSELRVTNSYRMLLPVAKVTENGQSYRLSVFDVEPGDLIDFIQGDIIPADARLVSSSKLYVAERYIDEASGKVIYKRVAKAHETIASDDEMYDHYDNMVYAGSMVVSGKGAAIVTAIGTDTVASKVYSGISFTPQNDKPSFLHDFNKSAKRFSLTTLLCVVPVALVGLFTQTLGTSDNADYDLLYMFLLCLALAATCMSELVAAPAESLVTKEILPSSRAKKNEGGQVSRVTKLSASEALADTDTILIMVPELLIDKKRDVRRFFFADKKYRFDGLSSRELKDFAFQIYPFFACMPPKSLDTDSLIAKAYFQAFLPLENSKSKQHTKFVRNYPVEGAKACVFETDGNNIPRSFIARSEDLNLLSKCSFFRTEGGGVWKIDSGLINRITDYYNTCVNDGLHTYLYISRERETDKPIFEGIVAVGEEFPYVNGELTEDFIESGIMPILVLEEENQSNLNFALKCGIVKHSNEIAVASEFARAGLQITDASISTKVYIGFGKKGTEMLTQRLYSNGKKVLPIIKDSANRRAVSPNPVYATHQLDSFDSVKIASSLSLKPADAQTHTGGVADALKAVRASCVARLKLGLYKNYLIFSSFVRLTLVGVPLLLGKSEYLMTALMVLLSGFICDYVALFSIMKSKRTAVRPKDSLSDSKRLFSSSLAFFSAGCAFVSSMILLFICRFLVSAEKMPVTIVPAFMMCSCVAILLSALGGFLAVLNKHTRSDGVNVMYGIALILYAVLLFLQSSLPPDLFEKVGNIGFFRIPDSSLTYIAVPALVAYLCVVLIIGKISSFASSK